MHAARAATEVTVSRVETATARIRTDRARADIAAVIDSEIAADANGLRKLVRFVGGHEVA